jgi:prolyl oligopeptidase
VRDGFRLPPAKCGAEWIDRDTISLVHAQGGPHTTRSGYGRTIREWRRGTPLDTAEVVFAGEHADVACGSRVQREAGGHWHLVFRRTDFDSHAYYRVDQHGNTERLDLPARSNVSVWGGWLAVQPMQDWDTGSTVVPAGGLGVIEFGRFRAGARDFAILFRPQPRLTLVNFVATTKGYALRVLDNIRGRILVATREATHWRVDPLDGLPEIGTVNLWPFASGGGDDQRATAISLTTQSFTEPVTYAEWPLSGAPRIMKRAPRLFDAAGIETEQRVARAADGTEIPYFLVGRDLAATDRPRPLVLTGYGGFNVPNPPFYAGHTGMLWLERGHAYAVANIRGGGEFGPAWHRAAQRARKHVSHDDFAAVARHILASGITTPGQLGCTGASNGGLLVGAMLTRFPELFGAIVCDVPVLDMARYARLLAGPSWIAEYGDPDDPAEWAFLKALSPYHLASNARRYPPVLITTNRGDDRVHPGHARKMAARLEALGQPVLYFEEERGGHARGADNELEARRVALMHRFFHTHLAG